MAAELSHGLVVREGAWALGLACTLMQDLEFRAATPQCPRASKPLLVPCANVHWSEPVGIQCLGWHLHLLGAEGKALYPFIFSMWPPTKGVSVRVSQGLVETRWELRRAHPGQDGGHIYGL